MHPVVEPARILSLLVSSQQSVGEIERQLRMPSKHLRVLRASGFVEPTVDAQRRPYRRQVDAHSRQRTAPPAEKSLAGGPCARVGAL